MIALIDGDILLYRIGYTTETEPEGIARARTDDLIDSILVETGAKEYEIWLSDNREGNFRYAIDANYKANRTQPRPTHYEAIKEHLVSKWGARIAYGMEADDALGINQMKEETSIEETGFHIGTVICSIDKDLLQVPGSHYNFVKKEWQWVEPWEGIKWFYKQILIGDTSDNVQGCKGIGPVKAGKAIDSIRQEAGESALFERVVEVYKRQEGQEATQQEILDHILLVGRLLKIKTTEDEPEWHFPKSLPTTELPASLSTAPKVEAIIPSTALTSPENTDGLSQLGKPMAATLTEKPAASIS